MSMQLITFKSVVAGDLRPLIIRLLAEAVPDSRHVECSKQRLTGPAGTSNNQGVLVEIIAKSAVCPIVGLHNCTSTDGGGGGGAKAVPSEPAMHRSELQYHA